ncbi:MULTISPECIES: hypothetical protein [unclassified Pseudoalteromonas]|uniref:hypothetical protein n=1 Tax=unclassified Pseudoalteromonas TaxID=194690 RepID=UPI00111E2F4B|nr:MULTISPECIES: hypothetical protein [unclassified Pseudoalteromonas]MDN3377797.1 hypothetical protein [Pseudoalteromonas sp. APC 3893]MDN3385993.1 hypothetical protein [Pseudoalteromonas sp. APC 4017]
MKNISVTTLFKYASIALFGFIAINFMCQEYTHWVKSLSCQQKCQTLGFQSKRTQEGVYLSESTLCQCLDYLVVLDS